MTDKELSSKVNKLQKIVGAQQDLILDLAEALHQHARTDCAPDEALPFMKQLMGRARALRNKTGGS